MIEYPTDHEMKTIKTHVIYYNRYGILYWLMTVYIYSFIVFIICLCITIEKKCNALENITNGIFENPNCTIDTLYYEDMCMASCNSGYDLIGDSHIQCNETGVWNITITPTCISKLK